jgi:hypothetical protein
VVGSVAVYHVTRDSRVGIASSYCSKGYPCFRVPTMTIQIVCVSHKKLHMYRKSMKQW